MYKDGDKYTTDSISYDYIKSDTLPDWQVFTKIKNDYVLKFSGIHEFNGNGFIITEHLNFKDNPRFYKRKVHHYDSNMNSIGYTVYNYAHMPTEKVIVDYDTINNIEIHTKFNLQSQGKLNSTSIDSIFIKEDRLIKQKKWTDWESRKFYNTLPKCFICEITYEYDNKGRILSKYINSLEGKGRANIQYNYNKFDNLISKSVIVNKDTTSFKYYRENDNYGNFIVYKEYKDDKLIKYLRRKLTYWED